MSFNTMALRWTRTDLGESSSGPEAQDSLSTDHLTQPVGGRVRPGTQLSHLSPGHC